jgi:coniferyl-aldehyde dehydrogenase
VSALVPVTPDLLGRLERLRRAQVTAGAPTLEERLTALGRLRGEILRQRDRIVTAIASDFGVRSRHETLTAEILTTLQGLDHARRNLRAWVRPRPVRVSWLWRPARGEVRPQPKGVVGIIAPWNYPFNLVFAPVVAAVAAGNRVMVKPSELTPRTSEVVKLMLETALGPDGVQVVIGGAEVGAAFARLPFDHLFFTGSTEVGKKVASAASENLVPVTLELGGKSPAIVTEDRFTRPHLKRTAASIAAAKLFNAGQTCIAIDHVFVPEGRQDDFIDEVRSAVEKLYPTLLDNPDYSAVINAHHFERLQGCVAEARERGVRIEVLNPAGEDLSGQSKKMAPTVVAAPPSDLALMSEEIFGPILPVLTYASLDEVIGRINAGPRPLALYIYSNDRRKVRRVLDETTSGGAGVNEALLQFAEDRLPFGGVGASGMGAYHGRAGFETFSHLKSVFVRTRFDPMAWFRPPFGPRQDRILDWLLGR